MVQWWFENTRPKPPMGGIGAGFAMRRCSHWHLQTKKESLRWTFRLATFPLGLPWVFSILPFFAKLFDLCHLNDILKFPPPITLAFQISGFRTNFQSVTTASSLICKVVVTIEATTWNVFQQMWNSPNRYKKDQDQDKKTWAGKKQVFGWYFSKAFMNLGTHPDIKIHNKSLGHHKPPTQTPDRFVFLKVSTWE